MDCEPYQPRGDFTRWQTGCTVLGVREANHDRLGSNGMSGQAHGNRENENNQKRTRMGVLHRVRQLCGEGRRLVARKTLR